MGIFDHFYDSQWRQREDIESLRSSRRRIHDRLERTRSRTSELAERVDELEFQVDELYAFNRALLNVLVDRELCTDEEFVASLHQVAGEIEAEEEQAEPVAPCPRCSRPLQQENRLCIYCGHREEATAT